MKWFGKAVRGGARPALSRGGLSAAPIGAWPTGYEAQLREANAGNAVAQRAVKLVAESVGDAPLAASDEALAALAALVAARSGGQALLETVAAQLLLHGRR